MTNRDFFRILIKVIGLYFFIQIIFSFLPSQFSFLGFDTSFNEKIGTGLYLLIIILFSIAVLYFLIRYPEKLIDLFKLDQNFDNTKISINNFNAKNIITIAVFIIGGFMIVENASVLLSNSYFELKKINNPMSMFPGGEGTRMTILLSSLQVILGFILIIYRKNIAEYFEK